MDPHLQPSEAGAPDSHIEAIHGLSTRAVLISAVLLAGSLLWIRQAEMVNQPCQITESIPPIPAVAGLILLVMLLPLLRRLPRLVRLSRVDTLMVYCCLTIATPMASVGVVRLFFPCITTLYYFATPENDFERLQAYFPRWATARSPEAIRELYEGAAGERVPWDQWLGPLAIWSVFLLAVFVTMLCTMAILRRQWIHKEHLTFPVAHMMLDMTRSEPGRGVAFFRNSLMWTGFGLAFIYNLLNMLNAFNPNVPALGRSYDLGALFTERPWSSIRPLAIHFRPEVLGIGYLVSVEVALSVWVFYVGTRLENVFATIMGRDIPGMPFEQEQSAGGYLALGVFLIWVARGHLRDVFRRAFLRARDVDDSDEPISYRWAVIGAVLGFAVTAGFAVKTGMWLSLSLLYFALIYLFAIVYARVRAEAGAPMVWLFPFYQHKRMILNVFGSDAFVRYGDFGNLTIFSAFMFMSRGYYQSTQASIGEALKITDELRVRPRSIVACVLIAVVLGLFGAYFLHLQTYYEFGNNVLEGGQTEGGYRTRLARTEYEETAGYLKAPMPPDRQRTIAGAAGLVVVTALVVLRSLFLRFPLHPLGFVMATTYGHPIWAAFFVVWLVKVLALKFGGMRLYRRLIPLFLGIALGHFFTAGVVWGIVGSFGELYRRYVVHFG